MKVCVRVCVESVVRGVSKAGVTCLRRISPIEVRGVSRVKMGCKRGGSGVLLLLLGVFELEKQEEWSGKKEEEREDLLGNVT